MNMTGNKKSSKVKAIICVIIAAFGFSMMAFFVRLAGDLPTMQKAFFRNAFAVLIAAVPVIKSKEKFHIKKGNGLDLFCRCFFGTCGLVSNFYAIDKMGIADANMLNKLSPFFAIVLSVFILKEFPKLVEVLATIFAFIGALFIIRPGGNLSVVPALVGLFGGFSAGMAYVFVRKLGKKGEKTPVIVLCFSLFSTMVTAPFMILDFHPMTFEQLIFLVLASCCACVGQFGITTAYRFAPAKEISVFDYTQVVFAAILGICFFDEGLHVLSVIGYCIIIGMAVLRWYFAMKEDAGINNGT